jgi:hypothetical protein
VTVRAPAQVVENESTRLELRVPEGCSSAEDFSARVARRSKRIRFVSSGGHRTLIVEIQKSAGGIRGAVTVVEGDGSLRKRQLRAKNCEEASEGLALIATVTLDPDALTAEPEPEPEPAAAPAPAQPKPPPTQRAAPGPTPAAVEQASPPRLSVGLGLTLLARMAPELVPGASLEAALEVNPGQIVSPFVRLSVLHAQRRGVPDRGGEASFAFTLPTLDVCPVRIGTRAFAVRPCAFASVGLLKVWGDAAVENETHTRLFAAAGGAFWLGLRLSEAIEIVADLRAILPLRRDRYAFDDVVFWRTPRLGFSSALGVAGGFP